MPNYHKYTSYTRYVDFKRLDFIVQVVTEAFSPMSNACGLDLGCGEGNIALPLASLGYQMVGVDISTEAIKRAEGKKATLLNSQCSLEFLVGDAENLTIRGEAFDFVICSELLEHLEHPEKALASISRVLKQHGILLLTVPNGYGPYGLLFDWLVAKMVCRLLRRVQHFPHVQEFSFHGVTRLIQKGGFRILKVRHSDFVSFLPLLVKCNGFCKLDCAVADKLPPQLVSGWYFACQKE